MNRLSRTIIVTPTYNELENSQVLVKALFARLPGVSLMVVDDSSPDGTAEEIQRLQNTFSNLFLLKRPGKFGIGSAYAEAFGKILDDDCFDIIITMDADLSHDMQKITRFVSLLDSHDFVVGSRYVPGGGAKNWSWLRTILSRFANYYVRAVLGMPVRDSTSGFTCFKKEVLRSIALGERRAQGYAFLVELKYKVYKKGFSIIESPIIFTERRKGKSKMSMAVIAEAALMPWKLRFFSG